MYPLVMAALIYVIWSVQKCIELPNYVPNSVKKILRLDPQNPLSIQDKKEEIWLSPMTKAPTPIEKSKKQRDIIKNANKKTLITPRLYYRLNFFFCFSLFWKKKLCPHFSAPS